MTKDTKRILLRGLRRLCPKCGQNSIIRGWYALEPACPVCGFEIAAREGDCWAVVYFTTAAMIGFVLLLMLIFFKTLSDAVGLEPAQSIFLFLALAAIVFTLPYRKGLALAIDYLVELR